MRYYFAVGLCGCPLMVLDGKTNGDGTGGIKNLVDGK
jgi:hypothetical protein